MNRELMISVHKPSIVEHLLTLDDDDRQLRFCEAMTDDQIRNYVDRLDFSKHFAFAIVEHSNIYGSKIVALCILSLIGDDYAEASFSTRPEYRRQGLAQQLFEAVASYVKSIGGRTVEISCLSYNSPMRCLVRKIGYGFTTEGVESSVHIDVK